jgi:putative phosphoribosyl transferase
MIFQNRTDAGRRLAQRLLAYANRPDVLVLALPRGGVPVAFEIARELKAPLDVFVVRKLGVPGQEELAMGAIASGGSCVLNQHLIRAIGITQDEVNAVIAQEKRELQRRQRLYRADRPYPDLRHRTVILVDDGLATGASMYAAVTALRKLEPARLIVAVPVAAKEVCDRFGHIVDEMVCVQTPDPFDGVGRWYADFSQTTDDEVRELLMRANPGAATSSG